MLASNAIPSMLMPTRIHVINPNSSIKVTQDIARAVQRFGDDLVTFHCVTLHDAPAGIVTQRDADSVAPLVAIYVEAHAHDAAGFVIACYSDPGLHACREITGRPVLGIGESSLRHAAALTSRIGVIAVSTRGIARHWRMYRMHDLADRIVGERAIDLPVAQSGDPALAQARLIDTALALRDEDGAQAIVLGCAGMAMLRENVERAVGIPVFDPCSVAAESMRNALL